MQLGWCFILLTFSLCSPILKAQIIATPERNPPWNEGTPEVRIRGVIHPSLRAYLFRLIADKEFGFVASIEISREGEREPFQVLEAQTDEAPHGSQYFRIEDMNFDGYGDIELLNWWGATGNENYRVWLFDNKSGRFVLHPGLSALTSPEPHPERREITTFENGGMVGQVFKAATYRFEGNRLVLVRDEQQDWLESKKAFRRIVRERKGGEMTIMSDTIVAGERQ